MYSKKKNDGVFFFLALFCFLLCYCGCVVGVTLVDADKCSNSTCKDPNQVQSCNGVANRHGCDGKGQALLC